jgi:hypothetical protein
MSHEIVIESEYPDVAASGPKHTFKVGETVCRIEDREQVRAVVKELCGEESLCIAYHEGGEGYWPASALRYPTPEEAAAWGL